MSNLIDSVTIEDQRILKIRILRHNPSVATSKPHFETFELAETDTMTLFIALNEIRETLDPSLQFDFVCRAGICGSCAMLINGIPSLACKTLTKTLPTNITLLPLPGFELIGDLSVNTGKWMRHMAESLETWIHTKTTTDISKIESPMEPKHANEIYELERCIECGCCIAACGTAQLNDKFIGAVGIVQIARFRLDERDSRHDQEFYQLIGTEDGVFGCMTLLGCEDHCPKNLPLAQQISFIRRKLATVALG